MQTIIWARTAPACMRWFANLGLGCGSLGRAILRALCCGGLRGVPHPGVYVGVPAAMKIAQERVEEMRRGVTWARTPTACLALVRVPRVGVRVPGVRISARLMLRGPALGPPVPAHMCGHSLRPGPCLRRPCVGDAHHVRLWVLLVYGVALH